MSIPDREGFRKINKAINTYSGHGYINMIYTDLYETIKSDDNRNIEPGNYLMYIGKDDKSNGYKLIIIRNGEKRCCPIYNVLSTSLINGL